MRNITIKDYYATLSRNERRMFRLKVCGVIGIEYNTFVYRLKHDKWNKLELNAISDIIESKSYEEY